MDAKTVKIGNKLVGDGQPAYIAAEIGINHNGDIDLAKRLISVAVAAGCDAVKFQKRTIDVVYTAEELAKPRETPFGATNGDLKRGLEFGYDEYREIDALLPRRQNSLVRLLLGRGLGRFHQPVRRALLQDRLRLADRRQPAAPHPRHRQAASILSTGMSTIEEIDHAVEVLGKDDLILLHACSTYPGELRRAEPAAPSRSCGNATAFRSATPATRPACPSSVAAVALGACCVERHITLDRAMWGSDQAASLEPNGITRLVSDIRLVEQSMGDGVKRVFEREQPIIKKLRRSSAHDRRWHDRASRRSRWMSTGS